MPLPHILYVRLPNWIGDVCMSLPALEALLATGVRLRVCARPWARSLLAGLPVDAVLPIGGTFADDRRMVAADSRKVMRESNLPASALRGLLLPDSLSSAAVFRLAGLASAGYRDDGRSLLLRWPFPKSAEPLHAVESWYRLTRLAVRQWGGPALPEAPPNRLNLPLSQTHVNAAAQLVHRLGLHGAPFVVIGPTATGLHKGRVKVWPDFEGLTSALQARGVRVVYCVPQGEADQAHAHAPSAEALPALELGAFAALTRHASLVVCNDSGVSHIAAAADARQLTLFGVTSPARTGPWSPRAVCMGGPDGWPSLAEVTARVTDLLVH